MKGSLKLPSGARWALGSALLVLALSGQVLAANGSIKGTVKFPDSFVDGSQVIASSAKFETYRNAVGDDGTYTLEDVAPGTYTISVISGGLSAPDVQNVVVGDGQAVTQDFTLAAAKPFVVVKSPTAIPLTSDIDSADFKDAPEILVTGGKSVGVGDPLAWGAAGGPALVSGRFRIKYSDFGLHLAADVTFKAPLVNNQVDDNLWNGNALEFDLQDDPYDVTRTDKNADHDWQVVVGLGEKADWWLHGAVNARPADKVDSHILRKQKDTKDGELFRLDMPWSIFRQTDASGPAIKAPADNALGAMDIVLDAVNPADDRTTAVRVWQVQWSGFGNSHWNASSLVPVQFSPQAPTAGQ